MGDFVAFWLEPIENPPVISSTPAFAVPVFFVDEAVLDKLDGL